MYEFTENLGPDKKTVEVYPGSPSSLAEAIDLVGVARINPGSWLTPFWIHEVTPEEFAFLTEYFAQWDINIRYL